MSSASGTRGSAYSGCLRHPLSWFPSLGLSLFIVIRLLYSTLVQDNPLVYHRQFLFVLRSTSNSYTSARKIEGRQKVGHKSRTNEKGSECVVRGYVHKKLQRLARPIDTKSENNGTRIYEISENCNERVILYVQLVITDERNMESTLKRCRSI